MIARVFAFLPVLLMAALVYFTAPGQMQADIAFAQTSGGGTGTSTTTPELETFATGGGTTTCSSLPEAKGGVLIGRIVPCVIYTIQETTVHFLTEMIHLLMPMFYAFLTVVITLFGVRVLQGEREIGVQAFLLAMKIAIIFSVFEVLPDYVPSVYGAISDGVEITTEALVSSSFDQSCGGDISDYGDANTPRVWKQMDCVIGKLFGFTTGNGPNGTKVPNMVLSSSVLGLLTGFFFGGTLGVSVFFMLVGALWSLVWMVLRVVLAFINGYLLVCVMLLITPIFLPLALMKITNDYFEKWWRIILGGMLMPVLVSAYAMFALTMYDSLLFADDSKLKVLFDKLKIEGALQQATPKCDFHLTGDPGFKKGDSEGDLEQLIKSPFLQNFTQPLLSGGSNLCAMLAVPKFQITDVDSADFKNARNTFEEIFEEAIQLFILAYLIAHGLGTVQNSLNTMTGSTAASRAADTGRREEARINEVFDRAEHRVSSVFSAEGKSQGATGTDFVSRFSNFLGARK